MYFGKQLAKKCEHLPKNASQNRPFFEKHFLKKSISRESWGQATRLKSCVYGSSSYGLFIEKVAAGRPHN